MVDPCSMAYQLLLIFSRHNTVYIAGFDPCLKRLECLAILKSCVQWNSLSLDDSIYVPLPGVKHSSDGINGIIQSSSNELSSQVSDNTKCKQTKATK